MIRAAAVQTVAVAMKGTFNLIRVVPAMIPTNRNRINRCAVWIRPKPIQRHNCRHRHPIQAPITAMQRTTVRPSIINSINRRCGWARKMAASMYTTAPITFAPKRIKLKFNLSAPFIQYCKWNRRPFDVNNIWLRLNSQTFLSSQVSWQ